MPCHALNVAAVNTNTCIHVCMFLALQKNFLCVDFIDTPGLVDGDMQYPFDVQEAILWMAGGVMPAWVAVAAVLSRHCML